MSPLGLHPRARPARRPAVILALALAVAYGGIDAGCGDGLPDVGEECDDGGPSATCDIDCSFPSCGDGIRNDRAGEECDDGNAVDEDSCDTNCEQRVVLTIDPEDAGGGLRLSWAGGYPRFHVFRSLFDPPAVDDPLNLLAVSETADWIDAGFPPIPGALWFYRVKSACGNGELDAGEECDDGNNLDHDACRADCRLSFCGDGELDPGEACDLGAANSDTAADTCRTNCTPPSCGDGVADTGEACDDGNVSDDDACRVGCIPATCGDGIVWSGVEDCDASGETPTCDGDCTFVVCGDARINAAAGEQCDDANSIETDACLNACILATCGDGFLHAGVEECDQAGLAASCDLDCTVAVCGDGTLNPVAGEQCDHGPGNSDSTADACRTSCVVPTCGDAVTDSGEACDDGNGAAGDGCRPGCILEHCGDGTLQTLLAEECDDGNTATGDGCDAACRREECGNGHVQVGEQCDDGNANDLDGCDGACRAAICGDGIRNGEEECDVADPNAGPGCGPGCTYGITLRLEADAAPNLTRLEWTGGVPSFELWRALDPSNIDDPASKITVTGDRAWIDPTIPEPVAYFRITGACGDGVVGPGEECDDGNLLTGDGCFPDCRLEGCADDPGCDDGSFCNGVETCVESACVPGPPPCLSGNSPVCDEVAGICVPGLIAGFAATPAGGVVPVDVELDASASVAGPGRTIVSYAWDFGDGAMGVGPQVDHVYALAGDFPLTLTVTDDLGDEASAFALVRVLPLTGPFSIPFTHVVIDPSPPDQTHVKAVGDLDGDGRPDVLTAGAHDGQGLYWYRYPDWNRSTIVPAGLTGFTTDVQLADVDGDDDLDVVVPQGYFWGESVWWYENPRPSGDPASATWIEHAVGEAPAHDVQVGDIDLDGRLDIAVRFNQTTIFLQEAPDVWTPLVLDDRAMEGLALGDLDLDGDLDVAVNGTWFRNPLPELDPKFSPWTPHLFDVASPPDTKVHIADVDGDATPEILTSRSETPGGELAWFDAVDPVNGPWTRHTIDGFADHHHSLQTGDIDLDGDLDVITAEMHQSTDPDEVRIYFNDDGSALSWTLRVLAVTGSHNLQVQDVEADGDLDLVGANWHGQTPLEMWRNDLRERLTLGSWRRHVIDADSPWRSLFIESGDLDGDGLPDVATGGWWYRNPGSPGGSWTRQPLGAPLNNLAFLGDLDDDGDLDAFGTRGVGSESNADLAWARNDGAGSFDTFTNFPSGRLGDFLQGRLFVDLGAGPRVLLSWHDSGDGVDRVDRPADPAVDPWPVGQLSPYSQAEDLSAGDLDGDGDPDVLLGTVWLRNDGGTWPAFVLSDAPEPPDRNEIADIDGDGRLDAVVGFEAIGVPGKLAWYSRGTDATVTWSEHEIATVTGPMMSLDVGDLDTDGDLDVVVGEHDPFSPGTARLLVFENADGGGESWIQHVVHVGDEHHDGARLVDIDLDGDLDILSIGWGHRRVLLYENRAIVAP